jgi:AcrR family transcriptional regulator
MKRAQKPEQKDQRRRAILNTAREFRKTRVFRALKLQEIADALDLAKGTLYRYFPTKQDLFMELYREDLLEWFDSWRGEETEGAVGIAEVAHRWMKTLAARSDLVRMIASLHADIEADLSDEGILALKRFMRDFLIEAGSELERLAPKTAGHGTEIILGLYVVIQGTSALCFPPARVNVIVEQTDDLALFRFDFTALFAPLLERIVAPYR